MREGVLLVERAIHWWPADGQVRHSEIIEFEQARVGDPRMHRPFEPDTRWWRVTRAPERRDDAAKADMVCAPIMDAA